MTDKADEQCNQRNFWHVRMKLLQYRVGIGHALGQGKVPLLVGPERHAQHAVVSV